MITQELNVSTLIKNLNVLKESANWSAEEAGTMILALALKEDGDPALKELEVPRAEKLAAAHLSFMHDETYRAYLCIPKWVHVARDRAMSCYATALGRMDNLLKLTKDALLYEEVHRGVNAEARRRIADRVNSVLQYDERNPDKARDNITNAMCADGEYYTVKTYNACIEAIGANFGVNMSFYRLNTERVLAAIRRDVRDASERLRDAIYKTPEEWQKNSKLKCWAQAFNLFGDSVAEPDRALITERTSVENFNEFYAGKEFDKLSRRRADELKNAS